MLKRNSMVYIILNTIILLIKKLEYELNNERNLSDGIGESDIDNNAEDSKKISEESQEGDIEHS